MIFSELDVSVNGANLIEWRPVYHKRKKDGVTEERKKEKIDL